jgi:hypothetical protein
MQKIRIWVHHWSTHWVLARIRRNNTSTSLMMSIKAIFEICSSNCMGCLSNRALLCSGIQLAIATKWCYVVYKKASCKGGRARATGCAREPTRPNGIRGGVEGAAAAVLGCSALQNACLVKKTRSRAHRTFTKHNQIQNQELAQDRFRARSSSARRWLAGGGRRSE